MDTGRVTIQRKRCVYCKRFFRPDPRVGARQKSCGDGECRRRRKRESQRRWLEANPGYFCGRYAYVREWRKRNPGYQRGWRERRRISGQDISRGLSEGYRERCEIQDEIGVKKSLKTVRLVIPEEWFYGEIQDEIQLVRHCDCGVFVASGMV